MSKSKCHWLSQWVSQWQGHLLSCCGQLKTRCDIYIEKCSFWTIIWASMSKRVHFSPLNNVYELTQEKSSLKLSFFLPWWTNSLSRRKWRLWPGWENKFYQFLDLEAHLKHSSDNIQNGNRKSSDLMSFASFHWKEINIFHNSLQETMMGTFMDT